MSNYLHKANISSGYRQIKDGSQFDRFFARPEEQDRIIIKDGEVEETVDLMKKVVWKYLDDTKKIAQYLKGNNITETCRNIWDLLFNHIQYKCLKGAVGALAGPTPAQCARVPVAIGRGAN